MLRVGLTGGIGSGKSEVSRRLVARGAVVVDADLLAREVVAAGTAGFDEVVGALGARVVGPDGELDRSALSRLVFGNADARRRLESIVHPLVRARGEQIEAAAAADAVVVHDIPLLVETGQQDRFDVVVVVDAPDDVRLDRLVTRRGLDAEQARARVDAQATRAERLAAADHVVVNDGDHANLDAEVDALWHALRGSASGGQVGVGDGT